MTEVGPYPPSVASAIGIPAVPVKTVFVKIRIELGAVLGNSKLLLALVSAPKPGLAAFVAVTTQFVLIVVFKTLVAGSMVHPLPITVKVTAPVPEPPLVLRINRTAEEEILSVPMRVSGVGVGVGVGVGLGVGVGVGVGTLEETKTELS